MSVCQSGSTGDPSIRAKMFQSLAPECLATSTDWRKVGVKWLQDIDKQLSLPVEGTRET